MSVGVAPLVVEQFDGSYSREFEEFARVAFGVVTPCLHIIGGERERLHAAVAHGASVSGAIVAQDDLTTLFDGLDQAADGRGVVAADHDVGQNLVVVNGIELALEVLFEQLGVVDALDGAI